MNDAKELNNKTNSKCYQYTLVTRILNLTVLTKRSLLIPICIKFNLFIINIHYG